jgi:hypothetical protein
MSKITINSKKIKVGEELTCIRNMGHLLTRNTDYEIIQIRDKEIMIMDNEEDVQYPICFSMDKDGQPNVYDYFKVWY